MSTISASTTTNTAWVVTADTTGTLVLQTGASPATAVTFGSDQSATFASWVAMSGSGASNTGILRITGADAASTFSWASQAFNSTLKTGGNEIHMIGIAGSANQAAYFGFNNASGSGANTNFATIGIYGSDNLLNVNALGNVSLKGAATSSTGVGISFPAAQSASSNANCLDDYEEGTWTPTLYAPSGSVTAYTTRSGTYCKIGRMVTAYLHIVLNGHTLSGGIEVRGFPFTSSSDVFNNFTVGPVHAESCTINAWTWAYLPGASTGAVLRYYVNNSPAGYVQGSQLNSGFDFMYSVTYVADA